MIHYQLPRNLPSLIKEHLEFCQWGEFIHPDTQKHYQIKNSRIRNKFIHQCATLFNQNMYGPIETHGEKLEKCWV